MRTTTFGLTCILCDRTVKYDAPGAPWKAREPMDVEDVASELAARFVDHYAVYHLPELVLIHHDASRLTPGAVSANVVYPVN